MTVTRVIGLTGGIGSGKSTVAQCLAELGAVVIDADKVGHEAYKPGTIVWDELVATFGQQIVAPDGSIDRKKLGGIVFSSPDHLTNLNRIVHPHMYEMMRQRIDDLRKNGTKVVVVDAAILIEANWTSLVNEVWVVVTDDSAVTQRVSARSGLPEEQVRARIRAQMSNEERMKHATTVIRNDGSVEDLRARVRELWARLNGK